MYTCNVLNLNRYFTHHQNVDIGFYFHQYFFFFFLKKGRVEIVCVFILSNFPFSVVRKKKQNSFANLVNELDLKMCFVFKSFDNIFIMYQCSAICSICCFLRVT